MQTLNLAENICRLRHERRITQEQLAAFIGVTKASVSKWETGQNTPDITILPQLATFFDVTIDALIGHCPQLSKEQIQYLYQQFADAFAKRPFEDVMAETRDYVKRYYSCYPFLFQIGVLWLNHHTLSNDPKIRQEILDAICELCTRICQNCKSMDVCSDAIILQNLVRLQLGQPQAVIDDLEDSLNPQKLAAQSSTVLARAYQMAGQRDKADSFAQICMYKDVLSLVADAASYLSIHIHDPAVCEATAARIEQVADAYALVRLHPNNMAAFEYQAAVCFAAGGDRQHALRHAQKYTACIQELFAHDSFLLHGDDYFTRIDEWFHAMDLGPNAPRSRSIVRREVRQTFDDPAFAILEGEPAFERLKQKLREIT